MAKKLIIHAPLSGLTYTFDGNHRTGSTTTASDDFNIQDAFSGQQVQAVLEAEIEFSA